MGWHAHGFAWAWKSKIHRIEFGLLLLLLRLDIAVDVARPDGWRVVARLLPDFFAVELDCGGLAGHVHQGVLPRDLSNRALRFKHQQDRGVSATGQGKDGTVEEILLGARITDERSRHRAELDAPFDG